MSTKPTVEEAILLLTDALIESKGWMRDYADAIIRDAIDRTHLEQAREIEALRADRDSWRDQASARVADAVAFADQAEALQTDAARWRHIASMFRIMSPNIDGQHCYAPLGQLGRMRGPSLAAAVDADIAARSASTTEAGG